MNSHWRTTSALVVLLVFANLNLSLSVRHSRHHRRGGTSSYLHGKTSHYNAKHGPDETMAVLTLNSFADGGDGGGPSECDGKYHSDDELVVALSTRWYNHGSLCFKKIRINGNGKSVLAKVVDECDSVNGYDAVHGFQPPCPSYVVDASPAVWEALGVSRGHVGYYHITWSED